MPVALEYGDNITKIFVNIYVQDEYIPHPRFVEKRKRASALRSDVYIYTHRGRERERASPCQMIQEGVAGSPEDGISETYWPLHFLERM